MTARLLLFAVATVALSLMPLWVLLAIGVARG